MKDKTNNTIDQKVWEMFEKSGNTGYYMLYNALKNNKSNDEK